MVILKKEKSNECMNESSGGSLKYNRNSFVLTIFVFIFVFVSQHTDLDAYDLVPNVKIFPNPTDRDWARMTLD